MTEKKSTEKLTFEEALEELEQIAKNIDNGQKNLSDTINNFERGIILKKHCEKMLNDAKLKIEKIITDADGEAKTENFEI